MDLSFIEGDRGRKGGEERIKKQIKSIYITIGGGMRSGNKKQNKNKVKYLEFWMNYSMVKKIERKKKEK